ncbi:MAG: tRNA (N6-isopentenyl adenosine(37)-C2)-methylthiotransferase MiaB [Hyphomicrobiaceae bacterium]
MSIGHAPTKKVFLKTYGCQMNVYDSERMSEALAVDGYASTETMEDADLIILNTCHIRERAADKVYSELGRIRDIKDERAALGKTTTVTIAGCVAQAEGEEMTRRAPAVDLVIGPQSYHHLPKLIARNHADGKAIVETQFPDDDKFKELPERRRTLATAAFLTVQEGCDKFCTFCVVPYTRGAEYSRPVAQILSEARKLVSHGVREITLLGQNVNGYHGVDTHGKDMTLGGLVRELATIDGLERIRYMTSHPRDMGDDLIAAHRDIDKLMPFLHLPFQAGSDRILAAMNRKHTAAEFVSLVDRVRLARPDIALSTDIIVGFPGETEGEFQATLEIVKTVHFASAYSFKFSARPGTPAASMDGQLSEDVKDDRLKRLQDLLMQQQRTFNAACVGKTFPVLFEKAGRYAGQLIGRSPYLQSVHADADMSAIGKILPVEIASVGPNSLAGVVKSL